MDCVHLNDHGYHRKGLIQAVRAGDVACVQSLLAQRPQLAHMSADNFSPLHYAVLQRSPEMTRMLVQHGADLRFGLYPHNDATDPLTLARERGYDDIVRILEEACGRPARRPCRWPWRSPASRRQAQSA